MLLALVMVLSVMPMTIVAEATSGTCGENVTWSFDEATGTMTISGTGDMEDYDCHDFSYYPSPWYEDDYIRENIKILIIELGVTSIGSYAFSHCTNLTSVKIADTVTTIGEDAFFYCTREPLI